MTGGTGLLRREVTGIACDSRRIEPGFLFAALTGAKADGRAFIADALRRGAVAILAPPGTDIATLDPSVPLIATENPRRLYALMAARLHAGQPETVVAVTGTNGKTSVASFTRQIWARLGKRAASIGTLGVQAPGRAAAGSLTTPDPVDLHRDLSALAAEGVECLAMEASSHGLSQFRLDGVQLRAAAFTNLTRDHLDYHHTMAAYLDAKLRLFRDLLPAGGTAVVNADDSGGRAVIEASRARGLHVVTWGVTGTDIRLLRTEPEAEGQRLELSVLGRPFKVHLPLIGGFQVENALCALGLVIATGGEPAAAVAALEHLEGAAGRLQLVARRANGAPVYVDYAHTPDALENVLQALRPHVAGKLAVIFGCGGDRDTGKRPEMGAIAARLADRVYVTDDNPRSEDPAAIRREIMAACPAATEIGDRAAAIRAAVEALAGDDLLVVAGKGHEPGQTIGGVVLPFLDADQVRAAVAGADA